MIYFSGDVGCGNRLLTYDSPTRRDFRSYLANGGRLLLSGQDFAYTKYATGSALDLATLFGVDYVSDSAFVPGAAPPSPSVYGEASAPYLAGQVYDLGFGADGAANQYYVDVIAAVSNPSVDARPILGGVPALPGDTSARTVGVSLSSEPTIERVKRETFWRTLGYRTQYLGFGVEGINSTTGFNSSLQLFDRLLAWFEDEVDLAFNQPRYHVDGEWSPVTVSATALPSVLSTRSGFANYIVAYRWDFGDGTPFQTTSTAGASHGYAAKGTYKAYVEATDGFGHKAVAGPIDVVVGHSIYLPVVVR